MKKLIDKKNIISFLLGGIICSIFSVYATTLIAGTNISYDNSSSKLTSTNVQGAIDEINVKTNQGTALVSELLSGKTALVGGTLITGTMTNQGAWTVTPTTSGKVTIPAGYHNGLGYVDTSSVYNAGKSGISKATLLSGSSYTSTETAVYVGIALNANDDDFSIPTSASTTGSNLASSTLYYKGSSSGHGQVSYIIALCQSGQTISVSGARVAIYKLG